LTEEPVQLVADRLGKRRGIDGQFELRIDVIWIGAFAVERVYGIFGKMGENVA
jgi:hypothetical protein